MKTVGEKNGTITFFLNNQGPEDFLYTIFLFQNHGFSGQLGP